MRHVIVGSLAVVFGMLLAREARGQDFEKMLKDASMSIGDAIDKAAKEAGGTPVSVELELEGGKLIWTVDVSVGAKTAEVNFDAKTGAIVEKDTENEDHSKIAAAAKVGLRQAIEAAAKKAGGKPVAAALKMDGDKPRAIVRSFDGGKLTDTTVDAVSGDVLKSEAAKIEAEEKEGAEKGKEGAEFTDTFGEDDKDLGPTGTNPFFVLEPGWVIELKGGEAGKEKTITITVTGETKKIAGVETRVVEEKEVVNGQVKEITKDYFAISKRTNSVYYFGEDVDEYKDGKVAGHGGAWLAGEKGARYGLYMPGVPCVGARFCQEIAPGVAMDRCELASLSGKLETPAGKFESLLVTKESSAIDKDTETKHYARGIGIIQDEGCKLVKYGKAAK